MTTADDQVEKMLNALKEKTGNTMQAWTRIIKGSGLQKHGEIVKMLKAEHSVTHGYANLIAHQVRASTEAPAKDPLAAQYAGKESLRPIYDALIDAVKTFGEDVEIAPKKTYVSLRRRKQFAIIQPSTKTRVDLGLNLKDEEPTERLELSGSFNGMVSHRVRLGAKAEVNAQLKRWLKRAYQNAV